RRFGGEPLWRVARRPRAFGLTAGATEDMISGRLPESTQRLAVLCRDRFHCQIEPNRWAMDHVV
ncbi:MAG TPA: hypothetical protein VE641_11235, partial [Chthoniobacterales bacterium]|nr:hypothetical protein [Chthoniobacterales bacterium]